MSEGPLENVLCSRKTVIYGTTRRRSSKTTGLAVVRSALSTERLILNSSNSPYKNSGTYPLPVGEKLVQTNNPALESRVAALAICVCNLNAKFRNEPDPINLLRKRKAMNGSIRNTAVTHRKFTGQYKDRPLNKLYLDNLLDLDNLRTLKLEPENLQSRLPVEPLWQILCTI
ncbi:hypothetical protein CBL_00520 [Carabus blaptoides fortunei]